MKYISGKQFSELMNKQTFKITGIYKPYRSGYLKTTGFRSFKYDDDGRLKEHKWNKENRRFEMLDIKDIKIDREFFKTYKKVFDVTIELENPISFKNWKGEELEDFEFTVNGLGAGKIKNMLLSSVIEDMPEEDGKPVFDWEDDAYPDLVGLAFRMSVSGQGLDTRYIFSKKERFKEYGKLDDEELSVEDIPF